jgi:hypothetical protein
MTTHIWSSRECFRFCAKRGQGNFEIALERLLNDQLRRHVIFEFNQVKTGWKMSH